MQSVGEVHTDLSYTINSRQSYLYIDGKYLSTAPAQTDELQVYFGLRKVYIQFLQPKW